MRELNWSTSCGSL